AGDRVVFTHPYFEDRVTYLSALRPFYQDGTVAGVVSVDSLPRYVIALMRAPLEPGDVAYVTDQGGAFVIGTGKPPPASARRAALSAPLALTAWTLHLSSDTSGTDARVRSIVISTAAAVLAVWLVALVTVVVAVRSRRNRELAERMRESAYHDSLTGLANRKLFLEELAVALAAMRSSGSHFAVLFVDVDRFSIVNDSLGHGIGDELLKLIAGRLQESVPPNTLLARLGGDEFTALLPLDGGDVRKVLEVVGSILTSVHEPFVVNGGDIYSGASIGVVIASERYTQPAELLRDADISMYEAKKAGRGRYALFDEAMHERARRLLTMEGDLHRAIARGEFMPYYQPIVDLADGRLVSVEALVRWERPSGGVMSAHEFIGIAEQMGVLGAIDSMMLLQSCLDAAAISREIGTPFEVSVNVSATHLTRTDIVANILSALERSGFPATSLKLEITETAIMENADDALQVLNRLRDLGVRVVIDDFGTGYSSLSYLRRLPITGLKIDRSFVTPMPTDPQAAAIVHSIVALAKTLGLRVTAEGVESSEQVGMLLERGVDYGQGYFFSKALGAQELRRFIAAPPAPVAPGTAP
ncbi:MAG TPA: EAL domain-containing protein, partial [Verrucomicrobiae bacterium]|nr:EAL domain-containing protein [Verrucomicrobiae bacterium]